MRTHGWGGDPPATDDEARDRIVAAAVACIEERGPRADVAQVAERLGVTRQTVYRYVPTREALFRATTERASAAFVARLSDHIRALPAGADGVVEGVLWCVRELPVDRQMSVLWAPGRVGPAVTSAASLAFAGQLTRQLPIDLDGLDDERVDLLSELMVRLIQSLLLDPGTAERSDDDLRRFLALALRRPYA